MWFKKHPLLALPLISIVAGAGVLAFAEHRTGRIDGYAFASRDSHQYYRLAENLAQHGTFSLSGAAPYEPDTWRTPGYPLFLSMYLLQHSNFSADLIVWQHLLNLVNAMLLAFIARKYMSERRALLVGLLFVIEPYHHWYALWLMPTTLFVTLLLVTWHVWYRALDTQRRRWFVLLGVVVGFTILVRPLSVLLPVVILAGLGIEALRRRGSRKTLLQGAAITLALIVGVSGAWMARNKRVAGHFALSHQSGIVLAYFKATEVMLWRLGRTADRYAETSLHPDDADKPHPVWNDIDTRLRNHFAHVEAEQLNQLQWSALAEGNKTDLDSFELSAALRSIGLDMLLADPLSTLGCCFSRCVSILVFPLNFILQPAAEPHNPNPVRTLALGVAYLALLVAVLRNLLRGGLPLGHIYFPLAATIALLLASAPQLDPRFRVPMIPMLLFVALLPGGRRAAQENTPTDQPASGGAVSTSN